MSTFQLDKTIFNPSLYKQLTDVWLPNVDIRGEELDMSAMKRWFMASPDEREAFDGVCRDKFAHALEAIGPEQVPEPTAEPFLHEIANIAHNSDESQAAWAALSLTLLLDQIPRNLYRTDDGLRKVYNHYDKISYALAQRLLNPDYPAARPDLHPQWRNSAAHRLWFYMPLMHSEDIEAHNTLNALIDDCAKEYEPLEGHKGSKMFLDGQTKAEKDHRDILDIFGRYPHRNAALGRPSTEEEKKFLEEGGATFGVGPEKESSA